MDLFEYLRDNEKKALKSECVTFQVDKNDHCDEIVKEEVVVKEEIFDIEPTGTNNDIKFEPFDDMDFVKEEISLSDDGGINKDNLSLENNQEDGPHSSSKFQAPSDSAFSIEKKTHKTQIGKPSSSRVSPSLKESKDTLNQLSISDFGTFETGKRHHFNNNNEEAIVKEEILDTELPAINDDLIKFGPFEDMDFVKEEIYFSDYETNDNFPLDDRLKHGPLSSSKFQAESDSAFFSKKRTGRTQHSRTSKLLKHQFSAVIPETSQKQDQFRCKCNKSFSQKSNLTRHLSVHSGEMSYDCIHCKKKFCLKENLKVHVLTHHGKNPYVCKHCDKKLSNKTSLDRHLLIHSGLKPFFCNHCHKEFSDKATLQRHIFIHSDEKPYECNHCHKLFPRKDNLNIHLLTHTGRKFVCDHCKKEFTTRSGLKSHLQLHSNEKEFVCEHCKKRFARKHTLKVHIMIHSGEKPFVCEFCKKKYSDKSAYRRHLSIHNKKNKSNV